MTICTFRVTDAGGLRDIEPILADSWLIRQSFDYCVIQRTLQFAIWQLDYETPQYRSIMGPLQWKNVPWRRWNIVMTHADMATLTIEPVTGEHDEYELAPIIFDEVDTIVIPSHMGARITVRVSRLDIALTKTDIFRSDKYVRLMSIRYFE